MKFTTHLRYTFLLLLGQCALANAAPVDQGRAFSEAKSFLANKGISLSNSKAVMKAPRRSGTAPTTSDYYIFNADNGKGFVVVSGDDRTPAVLGYSLNGSLDLNHLPYTICAPR